MVIYEHVKGVISVPVYTDSGEYAGYTNDVTFTENDIIKDSCSITSRACDDNTFSLGGVRPAELSIKLRLEGDGINAYNLYGAKIILYSCYAEHPTESDWVLRGVFWVTSVNRTRTMYTLRASDALVWLNSNSISSGDGKIDDDESIISKKLRDKLEGYEQQGEGGFYSLSDIVADVVTWTDDILQNTIGERPLEYHHISGIPNENPQGAYTNGYTLMRKDDTNNPEGESKNTRYSPIDYVSYLAQCACGFAAICNDFAHTSEGTLYTQFAIFPFGYAPEGDESWNPIQIKNEQIALDGSDVASYKLYIQKIYFKTYDEVGWSHPRKYEPMLGNLEVDLSGNPFIDGRRMETVLGYGINDAFHDEYVILNGVANYIFHNVTLRPFKTKCYLQFEKASAYPKLGQRISIEYQKGKWADSTITSMVWKFRGGWEFSCTGKDTRVLAQAAKRSLAFNAENAAKRHADIAASVARKAAADAKRVGTFAKDNLYVTNSNANDRLSISVFNDFMDAVATSFANAGVDFGFSYLNGIVDLPEYKE